MPTQLAQVAKKESKAGAGELELQLQGAPTPHEILKTGRLRKVRATSPLPSSAPTILLALSPLQNLFPCLIFSLPLCAKLSHGFSILVVLALLD